MAPSVFSQATIQWRQPNEDSRDDILFFHISCSELYNSALYLCEVYETMCFSAGEFQILKLVH